MGHLAIKWTIDLASFAQYFERLSRDQLFRLQVLMHLAAAELGWSHFREVQCRRRMCGRLVYNRIRV